MGVLVIGRDHHCDEGSTQPMSTATSPRVAAVAQFCVPPEHSNSGSWHRPEP